MLPCLHLTLLSSAVEAPVLVLVLATLATALVRGLFKWLIVRTSISGIGDAPGRVAILHELPPLFRDDRTLGPIAGLNRTPGRGPGQTTEPAADQESANTNDDGAQDEQGDDQDLPPDSSATP